jgi:hypothetical protein
MLRCVIIISTGGTTLYSKEFIKSDINLEMLGAIIAATSDFSLQRTGLNVSYIEMFNVGIAVATHTSCKSIIIVDSSDGADFARLISSEILRTFTFKFSAEIDCTNITTMDTYTSFTSDIPDVIRYSIRPVLDHLALQRGINVALLISKQGTNILYSTQDVDKISILAHHSRLMDLSTEVMTGAMDHLQSISLACSDTTVTLFRLDLCSFIVITKNSTDSAGCRREIGHSVTLLRKILTVTHNLTGN